ncbi:MAG: hypothetical protein KH321_05135 [Clostridium sp.]|jgi:lipoprotein|nr:hypothetical protein [Clostridium sp.]
MNILLKKITAIFLLTTIAFGACNINAYAKNTTKSKQNTMLKVGIKKDVKQQVPKRKEFKMPVIEDELEKELASSQNIKKCRHKYKREIMTDEPVVISEENKKFKRSDYQKKVRTEEGVAVILKPVNKIRTKNKHIKLADGQNSDKYKATFPYIGDKVAFKVVKDVVKDGKVLIEKDTIVYAKIGEVSPRAMGGAPAEMTIEGFEMYDKNGKLIPLDGEIASSGYSLSFWIGLAELATTPFLIGLAVPLLRLLPGGQAVVTPRKNYVVYY